MVGALSGLVVDRARVAACNAGGALRGLLRLLKCYLYESRMRINRRRKGFRAEGLGYAGAGIGLRA